MSKEHSNRSPDGSNRALHAAWALAALCLFALPCAMGSWIAFGSAGPTWLETLQFTGVFVLTLAAILFGGGPSGLARSAGGRIILVGCAVSVAIALNPAFHILSRGATVSDSVVLEYIPIVGCVLLWLVALKLEAPDVVIPRSGAEKFEALLKMPGVRLNLFIAAVAALPAMTMMSGMSLSAALWPIFFSGAVLLALCGLLTLAQSPRCAWALCLCVMTASGIAAILGFCAYSQLRTEAQLAVASLEKGRMGDVVKQYDATLKLSESLRTNGPLLESEVGLAKQFEKNNDPLAALYHWEKVVKLSRLDRDSFTPIRRVRCAMGDSLPPWRMLVFDGFPAIANPEMVPGIMRLAESAPDVRAKLLGALLAWDQQAPEPTRRKLLEAVQAVSPGEPSSYNLLKRLGGPVKEAPMWLPLPLIVGSRTTYQSIEGTLEEIGEVYTLVCLNAGHWEMSLRAAGTPLHEEWPIVRVEMNGVPLATTQVNKATEHDVPFTFDVNRNTIFKVRIVFQNREDDVEAGRAARRGLRLSGIKFSYAKL